MQRQRLNLIQRMGLRLAASLMKQSGHRRVSERKEAPYFWPAWRQNEPQWHLLDMQSYIEEGFSNPLIYAAIDYKVRQSALAPLRAYTGDIDQPDLAPTEHPLQQLCARPNEHQSWAEFQGTNQVYYNLLGNAYIMCDRPARNMLPTALYSLRPDRVYIVPDSKNKVRGYIYLPEGKPKSEAKAFLPQDIMHIKKVNPGDPLEGMGEGLSPLASAARSADVDNVVTKFLALFFQNAAIPQGVLKFEDALDDPEVDEIKARWDEMYGGYENWTQIGVLDKGAEYTRIGLTFEEMGFAALDDRNESRIVMPFGVPAVLLGTRFGMERSTYSNMEEARRMFWEDTFFPELKAFEDEYQYFLKGEDGAFVSFDFSEVPALQQDVPAMVLAAKQLFDMGVPVNQALDALGLAQLVGDVPSGDTGFLPMGLMPAEQAEQRQAPPSLPIPDPNNLPRPNDKPDDEQDAEDAPEATDDERSKRRAALMQEIADLDLLGLTAPTDRRLSDPKVEAAQRAADSTRKDSTPVSSERAQLADRAVSIADKHESSFRRAASTQFNRERREIAALLTKHKRLALARKATIDWTATLADWEEYYKNAAPDEWRQTFVPLMQGVINDQGSTWATELGMRFDVLNLDAALWFDQYTLEFAQAVSQTTMSDLSDLLQVGMTEGLSVDDMQQQIEMLFDGYLGAGSVDERWILDRLPQYRTEMIARTETMRASNAGSTALFKEWGVQYKEWMATGDDRTRKSHLAAWEAYRAGGSVGPIDMNMPFTVGGASMMYPGDPAGPARETINCRCAILPMTKAQFDSLAQSTAPVAPLRQMPVKDALKAIQSQMQQVRDNIQKEVRKLLKDKEKLLKQRTDIDNRIKTANSEIDAFLDELDGMQIDSDEWNELRALIKQTQTDREALWKEWDALGKQVVSTQRSVRESVASVLMSGTDSSVKATYNSTAIARSKARKKVVDDALDFLRGVLDGDTYPGIDVPVNATTSSRAFHRKGDGISLNKYSDTRTAVHEIGHALEDEFPHIHERATEFLLARAGDDVAEWLGSGYEKWEVTWKDDFISPYMGKLYNSVPVSSQASLVTPSQLRASEIISMGLEMLYDDPLTLMEKDPEFFDFILALSRGLI